MCRCAVVFSEPGQILACLQAIAADHDVEVVRINNKLKPTYDAALTAGYRCATHTHRMSHSCRLLRAACVAVYKHTRPRAAERTFQ
jgi:hypothetical protein